MIILKPGVANRSLNKWISEKYVQLGAYGILTYLDSTELPPWCCYVLISTIASLCFTASLVGPHQFVFDDSEAIVNNADVLPTTPFATLLRNDFWGKPLTDPASHKSYRPLTVLTFRWNVWLAGGTISALSFRVTNVVLHSLASALTYPVCVRLFSGCHKAAITSALLFAVHPVHTEAVAGLVGRADLLCAVLFFAAFLTYGLATDSAYIAPNMLYLALTAGLTSLATLAKEQGVTVIGVCGIYDILITNKIRPVDVLDVLRRTLMTATRPVLDGESNRSVRLLMLRLIMLAAVGAGLLLARWRMMGSALPVFRPVDNPASFTDGAFIRLLNYSYIYSLNAWLLVCPVWLCFDWSMGCIPLIAAPCDVRVLAVAAFWLAVAFLLVCALAWVDVPQNRSIVISLVMMLVPFLPASNIFFRVGFVLAERVLYIPSLGACAIVAIGLANITALRHRRLAGLGMVLTLAVYGARCILRSAEWSSEVTLFGSALAVCPLNAKVHYNIAKTAPNSLLAVASYRDAIRLHPEYDQALNNLANILRDEGQLTEAERLLRRALELRPDFAAAWMNLGIVLSAMKRRDEAEQCYYTAIRYRKKYPDCYFNLGNLFLEQKRHSEALAAWQQATQLNRKHAIAWNNMIIMLDSIGELERAVQVGLDGLATLPDDAALHFNVGNSLGKIAHYTEAEKHFKRAVELKPEQALYHTNLGVLYHRWKKYRLAEKHYTMALKLNPNLHSARDNLKSLPGIS